MLGSTKYRKIRSEGQTLVGTQIVRSSKVRQAKLNTECHKNANRIIARKLITGIINKQWNIGMVPPEDPGKAMS